MNLDRVVGRWELAAAARVSIGPSDKTRPNQAMPRPTATATPTAQRVVHGRVGGAARLDGGGSAGCAGSTEAVQPVQAAIRAWSRWWW